jgi:nucleoside diphosphate kinase
LDININKGYQVLNGVKAEGFVRFRSGYPDADLGRIRAQQAFIKAAISQVLKPQNIAKLPSLAKTVTENIKTNMTLKDMLEYIGEVGNINKDNILMERLPGSAKNINGGSYYIYDKNKTDELVENIYYFQEELNEEAILERNKNIKLEVYNGTDIPGLGSNYAEQLKERGFNIIRVGNYVNTNVKKTMIIEKNRKYEGTFVKNVIKFGEIKAQYDEMSASDIIVVIGQDGNK